MKIDKFWVVTRPGPKSLLVDIVFETDVLGLSRQFRGGLDPADIVALYTSEMEALNAGHDLLP